MSSYEGLRGVTRGYEGLRGAILEVNYLDVNKSSDRKWPEVLINV